MDNDIIKWISETQIIAQDDLNFDNNQLDRERYARLKQITFGVAARVSAYSLDTIESIFCHGVGYATSKFDVRTFILKDNQLLLIKERTDGFSTLAWEIPYCICDDEVLWE